MNEIQQSILDFFDNKQLLKNIRSVAVILLLLVIPIWYFGFKDTFTLNGLLSWSFGGAILVITFSIFLATIETKSIAVDTTYELDKEVDSLNDLEDELEQNSKDIVALDKTVKHSIRWVAQHNKEQQELYNEILTNERIDKLKQRAIKYRVDDKEKKATYCDLQIEKLNDSKLVDKAFVPYEITRILNIDKQGFKFKKKKGNDEIKSNPKKINIWTILIGMPLRATSASIFGTIPFMINADLKSVFWFYVAYLLILIITIVSQFLLTTYKTQYGHKKALRKIRSLQELLLATLRLPIKEDVIEIKELTE
jgi:hypothetical protein